MHPEDAMGTALAGLVGHPLDASAPALTVLSARRLSQADIEGLVRQGEGGDLLEYPGLALEVVFALENEPGPWVWRLRLHEEDLPEVDDELGEYAAGELTWRLIEWRDTRQQQGISSAPRLLRAR